MEYLVIALVFDKHGEANKMYNYFEKKYFLNIKYKYSEKTMEKDSPFRLVSVLTIREI